jgi:arylsulfatase A-like enzyme
MLKGMTGVAAALAGGMFDAGLARAGQAPLPYVVLIVLDGARPDYFTVPGIPHVQDLMRHGTQYTNAFAGILESETPSGHVSIGTGTEPARTGIPGFWWATDKNVEVSLFDPDRIRAGDMEDIIRRAGVPTIAGQVHAKSRSARVVALSGSKYYAADAIGGPDADVTLYFEGTPKGGYGPTYIPKHAPPARLLDSPGLRTKRNPLPSGLENHLVMQLATECFQRMRQQVTLINLPEFDWPLGHVDGGPIDPRQTRSLMQGFDRDLAVLQEAYRRAGVLNRTIFVLMADHGMMPLLHRVPQSEIRAAVTKAGTRVTSEAYSSGAYLWLADASRAIPVGVNLSRLEDPHIQAVYCRIPAPGGYGYVRVTGPDLLHAPGMEAANQYLLNTMNSSNAPDVVVLFTEGAGCEPGGQAHWKGDHGGTSWEAQHLPLILSGPGIRPGRVSSYPARLIDIAPTVLQLMGASSSGMQGLPLADALQAPSSRMVQAQQAASKRLVPVVTALQRQSRIELGAK